MRQRFFRLIPPASVLIVLALIPEQRPAVHCVPLHIVVVVVVVVVAVVVVDASLHNGVHGNIRWK